MTKLAGLLLAFTLVVAAAGVAALVGVALGVVKVVLFVAVVVAAVAWLTRGTLRS